MDTLESTLDPDKLHYTYNVYFYASYLAPLILLGVSLFGTIIAVYAIILVCWPFKRDLERLASEEIPSRFLSEVSSGNSKIPCWTCIFGGLKLIYGHEINECEHKYNSTGNIYTICRRHVRPWLLVVLFLVVVFVCSCSLVAFWCEFLIDESQHCDPSMDCFVLPKNNSFYPLQQDPIKENCTEHEKSGSKIVCYSFSFNYANALGNAGGVLVLASVIMNVQAGLWIGASSQKGKWAWYLAVGGVSLLNGVVIVGLVALPIVIHCVPLLESRIVDTNRNAVRFYAYWVTFLSAFLISGPIFIIFSKRLRRQTSIDGEEQYVSVNSAKHIQMGNSAANSDSESDEGGLTLSDKHRTHPDYGAV